MTLIVFFTEINSYRKLAIYNRGFYYLFNLSNVGISLMFGGFPLYFVEIARLLNKRGYNQSAVIDGERTVLRLIVEVSK